MSFFVWKKNSYARGYSQNYSFSPKEIKKLARKLQLKKSDILVDFGCGDGAFVNEAAKKVFFALGADINSAQLKSARKNNLGLRNALFLKMNFLKPQSLPIFNKGFARKSLHHLTDSQKKKFFISLSRLMPKGALFLIEDGIFFSFERKELNKNWKKLMSDCEKYYAAEWEKKKADVVYCFKREYPTGLAQWKAALKAGGFKMIEIKKYSSFYGYILARKEK